MRFKRTGAALALMLAAITPAARADVTLVQAAQVIVDPALPPLGASTVVVRDGRIQAVLAGRVNTPAGLALREGEKVTVVDLGARTLLPGLIDLHVHLSYEPGTPWYLESVITDEYQALVGAKNAQITLHAGFTTVRDLGSAPDVGFALRDAISKDVIPGPRVMASGPAVSIIGGHGDVSGFRREVLAALDAHNTCTGADECAARVRDMARSGADVIKITATGGVLSQQARGLDQHFADPELKAIVSTARSLGLAVAAHAHGPRGIESAARAGITSIEHGSFADDAALKAMKASGTVLVPTLMALTGLQDRVGRHIYSDVVEAKAKDALAVWGKALNTAHRMGVTIAFGTDSGVFEHGRNAQEFGLMVEKGGMSPRAALTSATTTAAQVLGLQSEIGTLAAGKSADMIAVDGNPLADVRTLEHPAFVMARGRIAVQP